MSWLTFSNSQPTVYVLVIFAFLAASVLATYLVERGGE